MQMNGKRPLFKSPAKMYDFVGTKTMSLKKVAIDCGLRAFIIIF